ncbi:MAG: type II secretion system F family protein [Butyrivibrio sp.]|nr:type II secretion system F family protein [Butyrivibrio sp.]
MAKFKYSAVSKDGKKVSGIIEGFNELDAVSRIKQTHTIVLQIHEVKEKAEEGNFLTRDFGGNKLDEKSFTLMCSQFSVILKAGVPLRRTCELIADKMTNKPLKRVLTKVADDVEGGRSIAASFADQGKKLFPVTFVETIRAGEESGNLDVAFDSMAKHYKKQSKTKAKVRGAMIYPVFVFIVAIVVVAVLMIKVVPTFTAIFAEQGSELPLITQSLIDLSNFFRNNIVYMVAAAILIFLAVKIYGNTESGRMNLAKFQLKIPVLGPIAVLNGASQFANTMAMMLGAGLSMVRSVSITSRVMDNYYYSTEVGKITGKLEEGFTVGRSLRDSGCLPDILVDMTAVGEESGELEQTLTMTAEYYDNELEQATADALAKLEPTILVFLAGFAGYIVIAIYMAMFGMYAGM